MSKTIGVKNCSFDVVRTAELYFLTGLSFRTPTMTARFLATALTLGFAYQDLSAQVLAPGAPVPPELRDLERLGDLRLKIYSIHGHAPLVVLLTEAPASAPAPERRYRHALTTALMRAIQDQGFSLFSLAPQRTPSDTAQGDQMTQNASEMFDVFRGQSVLYQPRALIGFGDGALAAARQISRESPSPAFVALVPSTGADTGSTAREALWKNLRRALEPQPRPVLVLESPCNRLFMDRWLTEYNFPWGQTILLLPQYDRWLGQRTGSACATSPPAVAVMALDLAPLVADWLRRTVTFPQ